MRPFKIRPDLISDGYVYVCRILPVSIRLHNFDDALSSVIWTMPEFLNFQTLDVRQQPSPHLLITLLSTMHRQHGNISHGWSKIWSATELRAVYGETLPQWTPLVQKNAIVDQYP